MEKVLILDDDKSQLLFIEQHIRKHGYVTHTISDPTTVSGAISEFRPEIVLVDLMMPNLDGFGVIKQIRGRSEFSAVKIVVLSAKDYSYDKKLAMSLGADAFLNKGDFQDHICQCLRMVVHKEAKVTFWGVRGTVPTPGPGYLKYGGNTPCVSLELPGDEVIILDAGTGILQLGKYLATLRKKLKIHIFITHPHYDHIQGLPFFAPAFMQGNEIFVYGSRQGTLSMREVVGGQMDCIYFPVTIKDFSSRIDFVDLSEGEFNLGIVKASALLLLHPGNTLGFRLTVNGKSMAYITDNELVPPRGRGEDFHSRGKLVKFLEKTNILIHDTAYMDEEYPSRTGWGHSCVSEVMSLGGQADVGEIYLFHHDPSHFDAAVDQKEKVARQYAESFKREIKCQAALERKSFILANI
ncbi:MAG: response regulator [Nitrospinota bacterium]|nr:response regulator [Nitrospinota bacterium]